MFDVTETEHDILQGVLRPVDVLSCSPAGYPISQFWQFWDLPQPVREYIARQKDGPEYFEVFYLEEGRHLLILAAHRFMRGEEIIIRCIAEYTPEGGLNAEVNKSVLKPVVECARQAAVQRWSWKNIPKGDRIRWWQIPAAVVAVTLWLALLFGAAQVDQAFGLLSFGDAWLAYLVFWGALIITTIYGPLALALQIGYHWTQDCARRRFLRRQLACLQTV